MKLSTLTVTVSPLQVVFGLKPIDRNKFEEKEGKDWKQSKGTLSHLLMKYQPPVVLWAGFVEARLCPFSSSFSYEIKASFLVVSYLIGSYNTYNILITMLPSQLHGTMEHF